MITSEQQIQLTNFRSKFASKEIELAEEIKQENFEKVFAFVDNIFPWIEDEIYCEFQGPNDQTGKIDIIITPEGKPEYFELVYEIVEQAPKLHCFIPVAFRPRTGGGLIKFTGPEGDEFELDDADLGLIYEEDIDSQKVHIEIYTTDQDRLDPTKNVIYTVLDHLVGEHDTEVYLGGIEVKQVDSIDTMKRLSELPDIIDRFKNKLK